MCGGPKTAPAPEPIKPAPAPPTLPPIAQDDPEVDEGVKTSSKQSKKAAGTKSARVASANTANTGSSTGGGLGIPT